MIGVCTLSRAALILCLLVELWPVVELLDLGCVNLDSVIPRELPPLGQNKVDHLCGPTVSS